MRACEPFTKGEVKRRDYSASTGTHPSFPVCCSPQNVSKNSAVALRILKASHRVLIGSQALFVAINFSEQTHGKIYNERTRLYFGTRTSRMIVGQAEYDTCVSSLFFKVRQACVPADGDGRVCTSRSRIIAPFYFLFCKRLAIPRALKEASETIRTL